MLLIYYDNYCPNCVRFTKLIKRLDWFQLLHIKQLRNPIHRSNMLGINIDLAEKQMASFNGSWSYGYETLYKIFFRLPIFWIFIPILFLFKVSGLGQFFYLKLAVNRQIIPLHCTEESCELK